jgi:hypothetical protein
MATLVTGVLQNCDASITAAVSVTKIRSLNTMNPEKPRCKAPTKSGNPCGAAPTATGQCFFHSNPHKASELGRIGGKLNRRRTGESAHSLTNLDGADSASERLECLYQDVRTGSIRPPVANVLMKLTDLQVRVREKTVIEQQIGALEEQVRTLKSVIKLQDIERSMSQVENDEAEVESDEE